MKANTILLQLLLPSLLFGCNARTGPQATLAWQGYAEGRLLYMAPRVQGPIVRLAVKEGDRVQAGDLLFSLDNGTAQARLVLAKASLAARQARLADLQAGGRKEDIAAARQAVAQAEAALRLAQANQARTAALVTKGQAPQARLDKDNAALAEARAALEEQKARLALVRAAARENAIKAAQNDVLAARARLAEAQKALADLTVSAPADAVVQAVMRRVGEIAGPAQPVVALLPPQQVRIRFFVPEPQLGAVHVGDAVALSCDACAAGERGRIVFISDQAEFTPPEIFTRKERAKLVYMVEAQPAHPARFHPGQPVEVSLP